MSNTHKSYTVPVSVKGVIFDDGKIWLRKNEREEWELPGGKLEEGEQPEETAKREIKEELGFDVEILSPVHSHLYKIKNSNDESGGVLVLTYLTKLLGKSGNFEHNGEAGKAEFNFFTIEQILDLNMPQFYKEAIKKADKIIKNRAQFTAGAFGIIFDENRRVLLVHRTDYDLWNLPGGRLEDGESPVDGVKREVKEETGFEVEVLKLIGVYSKPNKNHFVFSFICRVVSGKITLNDEADKIEYFEIENIPKNTVPKQVERIKDVLLNSNEVIFKTQAGKSAIELIREGKL